MQTMQWGLQPLHCSIYVVLVGYTWFFNKAQTGVALKFNSKIIIKCVAMEAGGMSEQLKVQSCTQSKAKTSQMGKTITKRSKIISNN